MHCEPEKCQDPVKFHLPKSVQNHKEQDSIHPAKSATDLICGEDFTHPTMTKRHRELGDVDRLILMISGKLGIFR